MKIETGYAKVNGTRLYYERSGSGDPLVLVHGWGFDTRSWNYQFDEFAKHYNVIRYDQRGFGKSAQPLSGEVYSHATDLKSLLEYLDIKKTHLLGHSFGGRHVTIFAIEFPQMTDCLILGDGALPGYPYQSSDETLRFFGEVWRTAQESIDTAKDMLLHKGPEGIFGLALENPKSASLVKQMISDYTGYNWKIEDRFFEPSILERLSEIKARTLVIVAELDPQTYHDVTDYQNKNIPNSEKKIIKGVGHCLMLENPEAFNTAVFSFLSK